MIGQVFPVAPTETNSQIEHSINQVLQCAEKRRQRHAQGQAGGAANITEETLERILGLLFIIHFAAFGHYNKI